MWRTIKTAWGNGNDYKVDDMGGSDGGYRVGTGAEAETCV